METVIYRRKAGTGLTHEEMQALEEAEKIPQVFDDDCPKLTPKQLAEFKPVGMTWEQRKRLLNQPKTASENIQEKELAEAV